MPISLYECYNAKVGGEVIYCVKGHKLGAKADGTILTIRLQRGEPLVYKACQSCPDFDRMGEPLPTDERGWK